MKVILQLRVSLVRDQRVELRLTEVTGDVHRSDRRSGVPYVGPMMPSVSRYASSTHPGVAGSWPDTITLWLMTVSDAI